MSHTQTIPQDERVWDHLRGFLRRNDTPERHLGFIYGRFPDQDAADAWPNAQPDLVSGDFGAKAELMDEYMLNSDYDDVQAAVIALEETLTEEQLVLFAAIKAGLEPAGHNMSNPRVFGLLQRLLSGNFTESELVQTYGLEEARKRMKGVEFKVSGVVAFVVTELPAERLV